MSGVLSMYTAVAKGVMRTSAAVGRAVAERVGSAQLAADGRRRAVGPFDHRGLYQGSRAPGALTTGEFPLGRFVSVKGRRGAPVGLSDAQLRLHACVVGPSGAGKTRSVIVPWTVAALRCGYSVVCVDVKGDLLDTVRAEVQAQGNPLGVRARKIDYTDPARSARWNWLQSIDSDRAVDSAVQSIIGKQPPPKADPYFFHLDGQVLRGLLELAQASPNRHKWTAGKLLGLLRDQAQLDLLLQRYPHNPGAARLRDLPYLPPDDFAKRVTGVVVRLDALARPSVEAVTTNGTLTTPDILTERQLLSVVAPLQDGQMAQSLSSLFINDLLFRVYNRFSGYQGPPVMLILDEAAQLADRVDYKNLLSVARSAGMGIVIALQDVAQFSDPAERSVALANCDVYVSFSGVSQESARFLSERLGKHTVETTTVARTAQGFGYQTSTSTGQQTVPVLGEREIMNIPFGGRPAIVHARSTAAVPFLVDFAR
ncbi:MULTISPECIES: type IV secretory system conjugative DNA transfer family protein [unclassified Amycolatopsis]|uniref:type IV secretory system conjugative DNA transfer family protein n=1 Tax=unclassified Amycolatopsis TaxID=2618356 RepID=UPI0028749C35|nr:MULTISPECIES: type IV secretory system conjugative DNA transfer family protein [unclassified Amycolatopsis]MDS0132738.1 type IV secretory system conjugative DNA transfer family protein [Amycolatopsis sp. 505]MDS0142437.1 type IV secretory system conjugative DNA transfer family protein [Amycolatopsis sp. CM201R]